jgi:hypothetical protein
MVGANYPRPSSTANLYFAPDRVWGTIFIVLYSLMFAVVALVVFALSNTTWFGDDAPMLRLAQAAMTMVVASIVLAVHVVCAVGIRRSQAWGFWATIMLSIVTLAGSSGATFLTVIPLIYSVLRVTPAYGPKPLAAPKDEE